MVLSFFIDRHVYTLLLLNDIIYTLSIFFKNKTKFCEKSTVSCNIPSAIGCIYAILIVIKAVFGRRLRTERNDGWTMIN